MDGLDRSPYIYPQMTQIQGSMTVTSGEGAQSTTYSLPVNCYQTVEVPFAPPQALQYSYGLLQTRPTEYQLLNQMYNVTINSQPTRPVETGTVREIVRECCCGNGPDGCGNTRTISGGDGVRCCDRLDIQTCHHKKQHHRCHDHCHDQCQHNNFKEYVGHICDHNNSRSSHQGKCCDHDAEEPHYHRRRHRHRSHTKPKRRPSKARKEGDLDTAAVRKVVEEVKKEVTLSDEKMPVSKEEEKRRNKRLKKTIVKMIEEIMLGEDGK
jgi:hypothetical protein